MPEHAFAANETPRASNPADTSGGSAHERGARAALVRPIRAGSRALRSSVREAFLYLVLASLVLAAWLFTRLDLYTSKSDTAYWLGVAGGVIMVLLFSYPLRKYFRFMQHMGASKHWFLAHMVLGVSGPLLILLHSKFQIGSLNAGVAFYSMVTVVLSGIVGRFLYLRLHRGLSGEKLNLGDVRARIDADVTVAVRLRLAPGVMDRCRHFERWALDRRSIMGAEVLRAMVLIPWMRWRTSRVCHAEMRRRLLTVAHAEGWSRRKYESRLAIVQELIDDYLAGAQRVATFSAWERLFALWHIAHVPVVYSLVISAIVHVIAVHAY